MLLLLTLMICLTSCATKIPAPPAIIQLGASVPLPDPPRYPKGLDWFLNEDQTAACLTAPHFRALTAWRVKVEAYYEQVEAAWALLTEPLIELE